MPCVPRGEVQTPSFDSSEGHGSDGSAYVLPHPHPQSLTLLLMKRDAFPPSAEASSKWLDQLPQGEKRPLTERTLDWQ